MEYRRRRPDLRLIECGRNAPQGGERALRAYINERARTGDKAYLYAVEANASRLGLETIHEVAAAPQSPHRAISGVYGVERVDGVYKRYVDGVHVGL